MVQNVCISVYHCLATVCVCLSYLYKYLSTKEISSIVTQDLTSIINHSREREGEGGQDSVNQVGDMPS